MNEESKAIYRNQLKHSGTGQTWKKHKYIAIKNGRYIYPEDLQKGGSSNGLNYSKQMEAQKRAQENSRSKKTASQILNNKERPGVTGQTTMKTVMQDTARRKKMASTEFKSRQINDQINSAHSNATSSKMDLKPTSTLEKKIEETKKRKEDAAAAAKAETEKKTETPTTSTEEKKSGGSGGRKKGSGSKKSTKTQDKTTTAANASEEAKALGLSDDDLKSLESNIDVSATDRETVLKNLALRVIKGDFGNGTERKEKLGKYFSEIQKMVNELMKELKNSKSEVKHSSGSYGFDALRDRGGAYGIIMHDGVKRRSGRYRYGSGDRPFQHDPGKRSAKDMSDDELKKAIARKGLEKQYNKMYKKDRLNDAKEVVDTTSNVLNRINNKNREKLNRRPQRERMDLSKKTDKELRDAINRELLEKQYSDLFGKEKETVTEGERKAAQILDAAGDVLGVTSSALLIAVSIKKLMAK